MGPSALRASAHRCSFHCSNVFEVDLLAYRTVGAAPVVGYVTPRRARRESFSRSAFRLIIDVVTSWAFKRAHACALSSRASARRLLRTSRAPCPALVDAGSPA